MTNSDSVRLVFSRTAALGPLTAGQQSSAAGSSRASTVEFNEFNGQIGKPMAGSRTHRKSAFSLPALLRLVRACRVRAIPGRLFYLDHDRRCVSRAGRVDQPTPRILQPAESEEAGGTKAHTKTRPLKEAARSSFQTSQPERELREPRVVM